VSLLQLLKLSLCPFHISTKYHLKCPFNTLKTYLTPCPYNYIKYDLDLLHTDLLNSSLLLYAESPLNSSVIIWRPSYNYRNYLCVHFNTRVPSQMSFQQFKTHQQLETHLDTCPYNYIKYNLDVLHTDLLNSSLPPCFCEQRVLSTAVGPSWHPYY